MTRRSARAPFMAVEALLHQQILGRIGRLQRQVLLVQAVLNLLDHQVDDQADVLLVQAVEDDRPNPGG